MLLPKKTKHRKVRIGKNRGQATRGNYIAFGEFVDHLVERTDSFRETQEVLSEVLGWERLALAYLAIVKVGVSVPIIL